MQEGVLGPKEEAGSMQRVDRPLDAADAGLAGPCHGRLTSGEEGTRTSPEGRQARETCRAMSSQMSSAHTSAHAAGLLDVGAESGLAGEKGEKPGQRAPGTSDSTEQFGAPAPRPAAAAATHKLSQEASAGSRPAAQAAARGLSARARHGLDSKGSGASACKVQRVSSVPSSVRPAGGGAEEGDTRPSVDRSASCVSGNASLRTGSVSRVGSSAVGKEAAVPLAHEQMSQDDLRNKILRGAGKKGAKLEEDVVKALDFDGLLQRQFEVESMLRWTLNDEESILKTQHTVEELIGFVKEIHSISGNLQIGNPGLVFQELMGIMEEGCEGKGESIITGVVDIKTAAGDRVPVLLEHVHVLRALLRLKVQDGADLDTAYSTLREARDFFTSLSSHAAEKGQPRFTILKQLRAF